MDESSNRAPTRNFWRATVSIVIYGSSGDGPLLKRDQRLQSNQTCALMAYLNRCYEVKMKIVRLLLLALFSGHQASATNRRHRQRHCGRSDRRRDTGWKAYVDKKCRRSSAPSQERRRRPIYFRGCAARRVCADEVKLKVSNGFEMPVSVA